jgi:hypothetical protein
MVAEPVLNQLDYIISVPYEEFWLEIQCPICSCWYRRKNINYLSSNIAEGDNDDASLILSRWEPWANKALWDEGALQFDYLVTNHGQGSQALWGCNIGSTRKEQAQKDLNGAYLKVSVVQYATWTWATQPLRPLHPLVLPESRAFWDHSTTAGQRCINYDCAYHWTSCK